MYVTQDLLDIIGLAEYKGDGLRPPCSRFKTNEYDRAIQNDVCFSKKDKLTLNFKWFWKTFNMYVTQDLLDLLGLAEYKVDGLRPPCSRLKTNKYDITIQYVVCCLLYLLYLLRNVSQFHKNKRSWSLS